MSRFDNPQVDSPALTEFAVLAREFCGLVEGRADLAPLEFVHRLHRLLPSLYATGLQLPFTDVLYSQDTADSDDETHGGHSNRNGRDRQDVPEWSQLHKELAAIFAPHNRYREVFDPFKPAEEEPEVLGSLGDDVADIYGDLVQGLHRWDRGETGEALWEWRFGLEHHWGEHATGAIRALHVRAECWDTWFPRPDPPTG